MAELILGQFPTAVVARALEVATLDAAALEGAAFQRWTAAENRAS